MTRTAPRKSRVRELQRPEKAIPFRVKPQIRDFANEVADIDPENVEIGTEIECLANGVAVDSQDGWVRLVGYGEHPHGARDVQVFDRQAAEIMAAKFKDAANSFLRRLIRADASRPIYRGHPDHPAFSLRGHDDFTLQGKMADMEARDDGLYVKPSWTDAGNSLLSGAQKLFFSPRWAAQIVRTENGKRYWQPVKLISAGLTPTPNIYGSAANELLPTQPTKQQDMKFLIKLLAQLGLTEPEASAFANEAEGALTEEQVQERVDARLRFADHANDYWDGMVGILSGLGFSDDEINRLRNDEAGQPSVEDIRQRVQQRLGAADQANELQARVDQLTTDLANERTERARLVVGDAVAAGIVPPASQEAEIASLANAADFANAQDALMKRKPVLPVRGQAKQLGHRKGEVADLANARLAWEAGLTEFANEKGLNLDADYSATYGKFKATEKGKALHAAMREKPE